MDEFECTQVHVYCTIQHYIELLGGSYLNASNYQTLFTKYYITTKGNDSSKKMINNTTASKLNHN